ncbi:DUF4335 domain-containing protein [Candidatus Synechococcus calcipolaris G9]|uniref:DUF4335 domain-containing protein n=1 Tax=Candidatus Synechococcus calcipolaris G9 TaxID=1497997 RepID=A0ABT6EY78_9SYNE|nr:DUF4335 domain-containing protein [Candidatus Synechococcus calcipolaris]MDG2990692.1 DUF4335 domain-containing protein [Candidatus Synechococcus calcipolaris G9]
MLVQRQYSLPNCILVIEGLSNPTNTLSPVLDVVTVCECQLLGQKSVLRGGREFLDALVEQLPPMVQTWMSGVRLRRSLVKSEHLIHLEEQESHQFLLTIPAALLTQTDLAHVTKEHPDSKMVQVSLSWLQLFDLLEALDQLCCDSQTLPSLGTQLSSLPRRAIAPQVPLGKQLTPVALGAASLAIMAAVFYHMPVPERRPLEEDSPASFELSPADLAGRDFDIPEDLLPPVDERFIEDDPFIEEGFIEEAPFDVDEDPGFNNNPDNVNSPEQNNF